VPEFEYLVLDEIYTYIGAKARRYYIFTAYGITDMGYVVRFAKVYERLGSRSLIRFLRLLPQARWYFSDGAAMYGNVLTTKVVQGKGPMTNLVESFNAQLRQYLSGLRRRTKGAVKTKEGLERQVAIAILAYQWLKPTRRAPVRTLRLTAT
jgi:IS1 family transposase